VGAAARSNQVPLLLATVAGFALLMAIGIAAMPASIVEPSAARNAGQKAAPAIPWRHEALWILAALFFLYVGVENGFGFWLATYSKSLGKMSPTMAIMTSSFFYAAMMLGRWLAPLLLRLTDEIRLVRWDYWLRVREWQGWFCRMICAGWWRALAWRGWGFLTFIRS
jgi:fucose permease